MGEGDGEVRGGASSIHVHPKGKEGWEERKEKEMGKYGRGSVFHTCAPEGKRGLEATQGERDGEVGEGREAWEDRTGKRTRRNKGSGVGKRQREGEGNRGENSLPSLPGRAPSAMAKHRVRI